MIVGSSVVDDELYLLQSFSLFSGITNCQFLASPEGPNQFNGSIEMEAMISGNIDLTILEYDSKNPPQAAPHFSGVILTVDITPIA
jgi:hypothetical protein